MGEKFCTFVLHSGPCAEVHEVMHIFFKNLSCFVPSTPRARIRIAPFLLLTMLAEDGIPFERNRTRRSFQKTLNVISFCRLFCGTCHPAHGDLCSLIPMTSRNIMRGLGSNLFCFSEPCRIEFRVRNIRCTEHVWKAE